jgi:hypothetical protein
MAGPVLSKVKDRLGLEDGDVERVRDDSPLLDEYREELNERVRDEGGGCCGAFTAAKAIRNENQEYR